MCVSQEVILELVRIGAKHAADGTDDTKENFANRPQESQEALTPIFLRFAHTWV